MVDEERRGVDHLGAAIVGTHLGVHRQVRPADGGEVLGDLRLGVGVVDDHPPVAFQVAAHRRMVREIDALEQFLVRNGPREVEPLADLLGGGEETVRLLEIEAGGRMLCHRPRMAPTTRSARYVARVTIDSASAASAEARELSRGLIGAGIAVCAWSTGTILAKYIDMGSLAIGFYRFLFFGVMIVVWMYSQGTPFRLRVMRDSFWGGMALGADIALFFSAVKLTSVVNATIIGSMQPIVVGVIAAKFFGEKIGLRNVVWSFVAHLRNRRHRRLVRG